MSWNYQGGRESRKEDSAEADRALVENPLTHRRTLRTGRKICFCERACIQELCCYWAQKVKTSCGRWPWCWCRYFLWFKNWNLLLETQWLALRHGYGYCCALMLTTCRGTAIGDISSALAGVAAVRPSWGPRGLASWPHSTGDAARSRLGGCSSEHGAWGASVTSCRERCGDRRVLHAISFSCVITLCDSRHFRDLVTQRGFDYTGF